MTGLTWNYIKNKWRLTIGTLTFVSLFADIIQIVEFIIKNLRTMEDLIKLGVSTIAILVANYPESSIRLATYAGRMRGLD